MPCRSPIRCVCLLQHLIALDITVATCLHMLLLCACRCLLSSRSPARIDGMAPACALTAEPVGIASDVVRLRSDTIELSAYCLLDPLHAVLSSPQPRCFCAPARAMRRTRCSRAVCCAARARACAPCSPFRRLLPPLATCAFDARAFAKRKRYVPSSMFSVYSCVRASALRRRPHGRCVTARMQLFRQRHRTRDATSRARETGDRAARGPVTRFMRCTQALHMVPGIRND